MKVVLMVIAIVALMLRASTCDAALAESSQQFKIVPGEAGVVEVSLNTPPTKDSMCIFKYNAMGATPENWEIEIRGDAETSTITCDVGRTGGQGSYLLFTAISLELGELPIAEVSAYDNDERLLEDDQFVVENSQLSNTQTWAGQLRGLSATSESTF
mmetsp:Transcript_2593/g.5773  ORF Transcript_2593/g.5773 Transcript_2593/m.5773 type:complete len:157 (+) Transcript_2593:30-500(+)